MENANQLSNQLHITLSSLSGYWPELLITIGLIVTLVVDLIFYKKEGNSNWWVGFVNLLFLLLSFVKQSFVYTSTPYLGEFMKLVLLLAGLLFVIFSLTKTHQLKKAGEYFIVFNGLLLGALLLATSTNLLVIYLGVELMSISAYVLSGFSFNKKSAEGSLKYLLFGAVSSAFMLFGMSLLYGFTQTLDVNNFDLLVAMKLVGEMPILLAVFMTIVGFLFKMAAAPMHAWSPDVYEASPTFVVAAFSVIPKLAIFVLLINTVDQFIVLPEVALMLQVAAILSLTIGNFAALWQKNAKRMLAYSSIAHTGFLLIALFSGMQNFVFYGVVYLIMNFAVFALVKIVENKFLITEISQYNGIGKQMPLIGVLFVLTLISLIGLPPTAGFTAKLLVFSGIWVEYGVNQNPIYLVLFVFGLFNTIVSLFYYLKIPYFMFIKKTDIENMKEHKSSIILNFLVVVLVFVLILLFFLPNSLMDMIYSISFVK
ncbi:MAG: NADH-quinone oxidoreductase subunit N [Cyclobacteriaceae bacterium]|nr:NADH-quinone oxidoreductase subunit N [Cyclobacteriaceae bacterium]